MHGDCSYVLSKVRPMLSWMGPLTWGRGSPVITSLGRPSLLHQGDLGNFVVKLKEYFCRLAQGSMGSFGC